MHILPPTLLLLSLINNALAGPGTNKAGEPCNIANNRLEIQDGIYQLLSDCAPTNYCDAEQSSCQPKRCRKDDSPFGYEEGDELPPKCDSGTYCPDEGTECLPLLPVDSACQVNRDDQCEGPPNFAELADTTGRRLNFNGSVCIQNFCRWANATAGSQCVIESAPFTAYDVDDEPVIIESRGNCRVGLHCDTATRQCQQIKQSGEACTAHSECESLKCAEGDQCAGASSSATSHPFNISGWVVVAFAILAGAL